MKAEHKPVELYSNVKEEAKPVELMSPASDDTIPDPDVEHPEVKFPPAEPSSPASSNGTVSDNNTTTPLEVPSLHEKEEATSQCSPVGVPSADQHSLWRPYDAVNPPEGVPLPPSHSQKHELHVYYERFSHHPNEQHGEWSQVGNRFSSTAETPPVQFPPHEGYSYGPYYYHPSHPSPQEGSGAPLDYYHVPSNSQQLAPPPPHAPGYAVPCNSQPLAPPHPQYYPNTGAPLEYQHYPPNQYYDGHQPPNPHHYGQHYYPPSTEYQRSSGDIGSHAHAPPPPPPPDTQSYPTQSYPSYPTVPNDNTAPATIPLWGVPQHIPPPAHPLSREGAPPGNSNPPSAGWKWGPPPTDFPGGDPRWSQAEEKKVKVPQEAGGKVAIPKNTGTFFQAGESLKSLKKKERVCQWEGCNVTKSPKWRTGPNGKGTLCNVHGLRYHYYANRESVNLRRRVKYNEQKKEKDHGKKSELSSSGE